jgi:hypothetical protein
MVKDSTTSSARNPSHNAADNKSISSVDSEEIDFLKDADEEKDVFRTKVGTDNESLLYLMIRIH